ncbi:EamA-like transporter family protein [bacterium YEK0313]|nr:EamA-like transporter family protein [bacterium YEK0313]
MNDRNRGIAEMTTAMALSGTIGWFVVVSGRPVTDVVFWRCLFGTAALAFVCAAMGLLRRHSLTWRQAGFAALGGMAIVANWLLLFAAYPHASISIATAVYNTQPFMLVGLGMLFLGERPTASQFAWLGIAFAGVLAVAEARTGGGAGGNYLVGIALALGAAFFYALAAFVAKQLRGVAPHLITLIQVAVGAALLLPFAELGQPPASLGSWAALATLGAVHTGIVFVLLYGAIQKLPTNLAGALSFVYPLVAVLVDVFAFGQRLAPLQMAGGAAILVAAAGMTLGWSFRRQAPAAAGPAPDGAVSSRS